MEVAARADPINQEKPQTDYGWKVLKPQVRFQEECLASTLSGGQAFRWSQHYGGMWTGIWQRYAISVRLNRWGFLEWCAAPGVEVPEAAVAHYFAADTQFRELRRSLPWRSDEGLNAAIDKCPTLRVLRQPIEETLLVMLIGYGLPKIQITNLCNALAYRHGDRLLPGVWTLPTWDQLAWVPEADLKRLNIGKQSRYVSSIARYLSSRPGWFKNLDNASYDHRREWLCKLPGVSTFLADSLLLFCYGHMQAFPADNWVIEILAEQYNLQGWRPQHIAHFARAHFGNVAGYALTFLQQAHRF